MTKMKRLALAALVLCTAAGASQAQQVIVRNVDEATAAKMRAAIDASTRAAARGQRVGMITGTSNPRTMALKGGVVSQELDASTMMYSVARISAEGMVEQVCVSGADAATQAVQARSFATRINLSARETNHVVK